MGEKKYLAVVVAGGENITLAADVEGKERVVFVYAEPVTALEAAAELPRRQPDLEVIATVGDPDAAQLIAAACRAAEAGRLIIPVDGGAAEVECKLKPAEDVDRTPPSRPAGVL